ncbi:MAG: hypothetical protein ACE5I4_03945 [Thermoplasmata archaeon]
MLQYYQSAGLQAEWLDKKSPEVVGKKAAIRIDGRNFDLIMPKGGSSMERGVGVGPPSIGKGVKKTWSGMAFHHIMKGLGGGSQDDLNAKMKAQKKGLVSKKLVDVHWEGGRLAGLLNGDAKLKTRILETGTDKLSVQADPKNDCVRVILRKKIRWTTTSKGIVVKKTETTVDNFPPILTLDVVDGIADHVRSI